MSKTVPRLMIKKKSTKTLVGTCINECLEPVDPKEADQFKLVTLLAIAYRKITYAVPSNNPIKNAPSVGPVS